MEQGVKKTRYGRSILTGLLAGSLAAGLVVVVSQSAMALPVQTGQPLTVSGSGYVATGPTRVLDTRSGVGAGATQVGPGGSIVLTVPNLPSGTTGVVLNVTATNLNGAAGTYVSACPAAQGVTSCSETSILNPNAGVTIANEVTVPVTSDGRVLLYNNSGSVDLIGDLAGYFTGGYVATGPTRVLDTRSGVGAGATQVGPGGSIVLTVPNLPSGTTGVVLNVTATGLNSAAGTYVSACPAAHGVASCSKTSILNPNPGVTIANEVTVPVTSDGRVLLYNNSGSVDLIGDLAGYFTGGYVATGPSRVLDTRNGVGAGATQVGPGGVIVLTVPNLPSGTTGVVLNVTATGLNSAAGTYVSACPAAHGVASCSKTSILNPNAGVTIANEVTVPVASDGRVLLYNNSGSVDLIGDLAGYFTGGAAVSAPTLGSQIRFGAFAGTFTGSGTQVSQLESELGAKVAYASSFRGVGDMFPTAEESADAASGHALLIAWDMGATSAERFTTYTSGAHDTYLNAAAAYARNSGAQIYLRPWAEMNADFVAFQPTASGSLPAGGTPAEFVAAWQHVVNIFRNDQATNVHFIFNPSADTYTGTTPVASFFPGKAYVDLLGLDGYNWGADGPNGWRSFDFIFADQYKNLTALDPGVPVWICETGSKEPAESDGGAIDPAHSKADWYSAAMSSTAFPAVQVFAMFDTRKERDWRVASNPDTLRLVSGIVQAAAGR